MTPIDKVRAALEIALWRHDDGQQGYQLHPENAERIREALSQLDGMVLVPVEPTELMLMKGESAHLIPYLDDTPLPDTRESVINIYRAMIAPYVKGE